MYKIGIIGGMGPQATNELYSRIISNTNAKSDNEHIDTIILSHASLPDRTNAILTNTGKAFLSKIKSDFNILNSLNVEKIGIPCNTSHYFYDEFLKMTDINIVNMVEETIMEVKSLGYKSAIVFGTMGTYTAKIYEKYAKVHNLNINYIDENEKKFIMDLIYDIKKNGSYKSKDFENLIKKYTSGDVMGILACTELSLIPLDYVLKEHTIDALDVLVKSLIN